MKAVSVHVMINLPVEAIPSERIASLLDYKQMKQQYTVVGATMVESKYLWKLYSSVGETNTSSFLLQDPKDVNGGRTS